MHSEIIDGVEYKEATIRGRTKLIDRDGNAINPIRRKQKATTHVNADGYLCFGGGIPVHTYVAQAWLDGYFEGAEVNHKDFNRQNNNVENLEWVTHADNVKYSVKENSEVWNKSRQGIHNGRATFTEAEARLILDLYHQNFSVNDIYNLFAKYEQELNIKYGKDLKSNIYNICKGLTWKHLS